MDLRDNRKIKDGETIEIGPEPRMPRLRAHLENGEAHTITWEFSSTHTRRSSYNVFEPNTEGDDPKKSRTEAGKDPNKGYRACNPEDLDTREFTDELSDVEKWHVSRDNYWFLTERFFGAGERNADQDSTFASIRARSIDETGFNIHGKNPEVGTVIDYLDGYVGAFQGGNVKGTIFEYAGTIAYHESSTAARQAPNMLQFNDAYNAGEGLRGLPNFGYPDGWGIMQIDHSASCKAVEEDDGTVAWKNDDPVPTWWLWNWKQNVGAGYEVMVEKQDAADAYFDALLDEFGDDPDWLPPPKIGFSGSDPVLINPATNQPVEDGVTLNSGWPVLTERQACAIQGYNGFSDSQIVNGEEFSTCILFNPSGSGYLTKWMFVENINGYVMKVARDHSRL